MMNTVLDVIGVLNPTTGEYDDVGGLGDLQDSKPLIDDMKTSNDQALSETTADEASHSKRYRMIRNTKNFKVGKQTPKFLTSKGVPVVVPEDKFNEAAKSAGGGSRQNVSDVEGDYLRQQIENKGGKNFTSGEPMNWDHEIQT